MEENNITISKDEIDYQLYRLGLEDMEGDEVIQKAVTQRVWELIEYYDLIGEAVRDLYGDLVPQDEDETE